jgi:hypothetical protein
MTISLASLREIRKTTKGSLPQHPQNMVTRRSLVGVLPPHDGTRIPTSKSLIPNVGVLLWGGSEVLAGARLPRPHLPLLGIGEM